MYRGKQLWDPVQQLVDILNAVAREMARLPANLKHIDHAHRP